VSDLFPDTPNSKIEEIMVLAAEGDLAQARLRVEAALKEAPEDPQMLNASGLLYLQEGALPEAQALFGKALERHPQEPRLWENMAISAWRQGHFELAARAYALAAERSDKPARILYESAMCKLAYGDYEGAWAGFEKRFEAYPDLLKYVPPKAQRWAGLFVKGQHLLVVVEQGLGDIIMMSRYLPFLSANGLTVSLLCPPSMKTLMQGLPGITGVYTFDEALPKYNYYLPIMSLPALFKTTPSTIPQNFPYLLPPEDHPRPWGSMLDEKDCGVRIGLRWAGHARHKRDAERSCPPEALAPLFGLKGVLFVSLQTDDGEPEKLDATLAQMPGVVDARPWMTDLASTAALMEDLNLIITVDTATLHLAGAMNRPVWALLDAHCDWRWGIGQDKSPWYPSVLLHRQARPGDWESLMTGVCGMLNGILNDTHAHVAKEGSE
jgi:tetratricopeptide (TPR) repeat protein